MHHGPHRTRFAAQSRRREHHVRLPSAEAHGDVMSLAEMDSCCRGQSPPGLSRDQALTNPASSSKPTAVRLRRRHGRFAAISARDVIDEPLPMPSQVHGFVRSRSETRRALDRCRPRSYDRPTVQSVG